MRLHNRFSDEDAVKLSFRCSAQEQRDYEALAAKVENYGTAGISLSKWIRRVLNNEVVNAKLAASKAAEKANVRQSAGETSDKPSSKRKGAGRGNK